ncbi:MAG: anti-sigma factor domain-containing protein [Gaiellaceae bacterium]|jgi:anti-sigma-K factor RskA
MEPLTLHDYTAAYALDALDREESARYEEHLATCAECQEQLAQLSGAAGALAFAVESPAPPAELRSRILDAAREERPNVKPLRPRWVPAAYTIAAVAAVAAIGLGIWAVDLSRSLDRERTARQRIEKTIGSPTAAVVRVTGQRSGTLLVAPSGNATLIVSQLPAAPKGRIYEAWVIKNNMPVRAGTFPGGGDTIIIPLDRRVPRGAIVAVTLEPKPGGAAPSGKVVLHSQPV